MLSYSSEENCMQKNNDIQATSCKKKMIHKLRNFCENMRQDDV